MVSVNEFLVFNPMQNLVVICNRNSFSQWPNFEEPAQMFPRFNKCFSSSSSRSRSLYAYRLYGGVGGMNF